MKNREIKFRVWNGYKMELNVMAGFLGAFYVQGIDEKDAASMSHFNTKYLPETPVMQFTGLKDKNGKEIYEGDVVKWGHANEYSYESWYRIAEVELFPSLQFKILHYIVSKTLEIKPTDNHVFGYANFAYKETEKHIEIIGNIFENP